MAEHRAAGVGRTVSFGPFRLDPEQQLLREGDTRVVLGSRAMEILIALVERAGELVSKEELIARVWPNTFVDETNLRVNVAGLRRALRDGQAGNRYIATDPGRGYRFVAPISVPQPGTAIAQPAAPRIDNLPGTLTRVIGREPIVAALSAQLPQRRFITLVGPGGIGKTTVAIAVARSLAASYRDGVTFLDLAPIGDAKLLSSALATVLGLAIPSDNRMPGLLAHLRDRQMLLVLDSCEQVVEAAAALAEDVYAAAPGVHILATSQEPLRAAGERVHRLSPLESPAATAGLTAAEALTFPGVQLFVERAAAANLNGFELRDGDAPVVAEICRRLDGIPLAIELATGCVDAFGVHELASRLDDRFRLLTSGRRTALPRHRTLGATLDWSYQLCPRTNAGCCGSLRCSPGISRWHRRLPWAAIMQRRRPFRLAIWSASHSSPSTIGANLAIIACSIARASMHWKSSGAAANCATRAAGTRTITANCSRSPKPSTNRGRQSSGARPTPATSTTSGQHWPGRLPRRAIHPSALR